MLAYTRTNQSIAKSDLEIYGSFLCGDYGINIQNMRKCSCLNWSRILIVEISRRTFIIK